MTQADDMTFLSLAGSIEEAAQTICEDHERAYLTPYGIETHLYWSGVRIEVSVEDRIECGGPCGQQVTRKGPVDWIDPKDGWVQGGFSHQHGCGTWNSPIHVTKNLILGNYDVTTEEGQQHITELVLREVSNLQPELRSKYDDWYTSALDERKERTRRDLIEAAHYLNAAVRDPLLLAVTGSDIRELLREAGFSGSQDEPGVWINEDGRLVSWDRGPVDDGSWFELLLDDVVDDLDPVRVAEPAHSALRVSSTQRGGPSPMAL